MPDTAVWVCMVLAAVLLVAGGLWWRARLRACDRRTAERGHLVVGGRRTARVYRDPRWDDARQRRLAELGITDPAVDPADPAAELGGADVAGGAGAVGPRLQLLRGGRS